MILLSISCWCCFLRVDCLLNVSLVVLMVLFQVLVQMFVHFTFLKPAKSQNITDFVCPNLNRDSRRLWLKPFFIPYLSSFLRFNKRLTANLLSSLERGLILIYKERWTEAATLEVLFQYPSSTASYIKYLMIFVYVNYT